MSDLLEAVQRVRDRHPDPGPALRRLLVEAGRAAAVSENVNETLRTMPGGYWATVPCEAADELARLFLALGYEDTWTWIMFEHRGREGDHTCIEDRPMPLMVARLSG